MLINSQLQYLKATVAITQNQAEYMVGNQDQNTSLNKLARHIWH